MAGQPSPPPPAPPAAPDEDIPRVPESGALDARFRVAFNEPLPAYDQPFARAFSASDSQKQYPKLYALVCDPAIPVRSEHIGPIARLSDHALLKIAGHGYRDGPDPGETSQIVVIEYPLGGRLVDNLHKPFKPWPEETLVGQVLPAVLNGLAALHAMGISHRALNPTNLYYLDAAKTRVALGECVTTPPGLAQSAVFETVERAMAIPAGRGEGDAACDFYALGITLLTLISGKPPMDDGEVEKVNHARLVHGSYRALIGEAAMSRAFADLLAGLLCDAADMRWGEAEVRRWIEKKRTVAPPTPGRRRALQPYRFRNQDFFEPRSLAYAFAENWDDARTAVRQGRLASWLERSLNDSKGAAAVDAVLAQADGKKGIKRIEDDELVARICMTLDPEGPIRCRHGSIMVDGFGPALAQAMREDNTDAVRSIAETVMTALPVRWIEMNGGGHRRGASDMSVFLRLDALLRERMPGFGIERCLYELNPGLSCRSPLFGKHAVLSLRQLLVALEALAGARSDANPIDLHVAAFIGARLSLRDGVSAPAGSAAAGQRVERLAVLRLLALAQASERNESAAPLGPLPKLCALMAKRLAPALAGFRSRRLRQQMQESLTSTAARGSLAELLKLLLNPQLLKQDSQGFAAARRELQAIVAERHDIEHGGSRRRAAALQIGRQISAGLAYLVLLVSFAYLGRGWMGG